MTHKAIRILSAVLLAAALAILPAAPCFAAIQGDDSVGATTVTDRGLTITEAPTVDAECGILCYSDGTVLWSRKADTERAMASITKVMTAIVALENGNLDDVYTVSAAAASVGESSAGLHAGDKVSLYNLLCGLIVHSGNDAAVAIAEGVGGSQEAFVQMMNDKAAELGLKHTHFANPHGLDANGHYSTAADICVFSRYAMTKETFRDIAGMKEVTLDYGSGEQTLRSTNSLLNTWDECEGIKTGFTGNAGQCLTSAAVHDGVELFCVVLGCDDEAQRFTDSYRLLDWGFKHYRSYTLATAGDTLVDVPLTGFVNRTVPAGVAEDVNAMVLDYDGDVSVDVSLGDTSGSFKAGDRVGTVTWRQGEHVVASAPLVSQKRVFRPLAISSIWTSVCRLVGWFTGDDAVADGTLYLTTVEVQRHDDLSGEAIDEDLEADMIADARSGA